MANINGLYYKNKTYIDWFEAESMIKEELNCDYIMLNEISRMEDEIDISFKITDEENESIIQEFFKKYCSNEEIFNTFCEQFYYEEVSLPREICLSIFKHALSQYDKRIEPIGIEASYDGIGIIFEFNKSKPKSGIAMINRDSTLADLKLLLSKITNNIDENLLEETLNVATEKESLLDFIIEDTLNVYLEKHFSNWTLEILDSEETNFTVASISVF